MADNTEDAIGTPFVPPFVTDAPAAAVDVLAVGVFILRFKLRVKLLRDSVIEVDAAVAATVPAAAAAEMTAVPAGGIRGALFRATSDIRAAVAPPVIAGRGVPLCCAMRWRVAGVTAANEVAAAEDLDFVVPTMVLEFATFVDAFDFVVAPKLLVFNMLEDACPFTDGGIPVDNRRCTPAFAAAALAAATAAAAVDAPPATAPGRTERLCRREADVEAVCGARLRAETLILALGREPDEMTLLLPAPRPRPSSMARMLSMFCLF